MLAKARAPRRPEVVAAWAFPVGAPVELGCSLAAPTSGPLPRRAVASPAAGAVAVPPQPQAQSPGPAQQRRGCAARPPGSEVGASVRSAGGSRPPWAIAKSGRWAIGAGCPRRRPALTLRRRQKAPCTPPPALHLQPRKALGTPRLRLSPQRRRSLHLAPFPASADLLQGASSEDPAAAASLCLVAAAAARRAAPWHQRPWL